jgi:hypothetical protein
MYLKKRIVCYCLVILIFLIFIDILTTNTKSKNLRIENYKNISDDHMVIQLLIKRSLDLEDHINKLYKIIKNL